MGSLVFDHSEKGQTYRRAYRKAHPAINFRTDLDQFELICKFAEKYKVSRNEAVRMLIEWGLECELGG